MDGCNGAVANAEAVEGCAPGVGPSREAHAAAVSSLVLLGLAVVLMGLVIVAAFRGFPTMRAAVEDMGLGIPASTRIVLSPFLRWTLVALLLAAVAKEMVLRSVWIRLVANAALLVAACLVREFVLVAVNAPLILLWQSLAK